MIKKIYSILKIYSEENILYSKDLTKEKYILIKRCIVENSYDIYQI